MAPRQAGPRVGLGLLWLSDYCGVIELSPHLQSRFCPSERRKHRSGLKVIWKHAETLRNGYGHETQAREHYSQRGEASEGMPITAK